MARSPQSPKAIGAGTNWIRPALFLSFVALSAFALLFSPLRHLVELHRLHEVLGRLGDSPAAPVLFVVGFVCLSLLGSPLVPMVVAGAAVFGFGRGFALNYVGVILGASCSYWLARLLGREFVGRVLGSRYKALESHVQRGGLWPMVRLRFLPIPFPVANYGPALLGVGYPHFVSSTALAYVPILLVYSYFAAAVVRVGESERKVILGRLAFSILLLLLLTFLPSWIGSLKRRRKYRHQSKKRDAHGL